MNYLSAMDCNIMFDYIKCINKELIEKIGYTIRDILDNWASKDVILSGVYPCNKTKLQGLYTIRFPYMNRLNDEYVVVEDDVVYIYPYWITSKDVYTIYTFLSELRENYDEMYTWICKIIEE